MQLCLSPGSQIWYLTKWGSKRPSSSEVTSWLDSVCLWELASGDSSSYLRTVCLLINLLFVMTLISFTLAQAALLWGTQWFYLGVHKDTYMHACISETAGPAMQRLHVQIWRAKISADVALFDMITLLYLFRPQHIALSASYSPTIGNRTNS